MDPARPDALTTSTTRSVANGNVRRGTFERRMAIEVSVVRELTALRALEGEWRALASGPGALFRGPDWLIHQSEGRVWM